MFNTSRKVICSIRWEPTICKQIPDTAQKEWFEQFELHLDTIIPEKRDAVVTALIRNWNTIANCYVIFALNAQERAAVVILRLLSQYNNEQFASVLNLVNSSYRNFLFVHCLTRYYRDNDPVWQKKLLEEQAYKMGQAVIEQEINLFDDEYYLRDNAISFAQFQNKSKTESTCLSGSHLIFILLCMDLLQDLHHRRRGLYDAGLAILWGSKFISAGFASLPDLLQLLLDCNCPGDEVYTVPCQTGLCEMFSVNNGLLR